MGREGDETAKRIAVTAHIDAKMGTPGAIDNATGVVVLLLLSDLLRNYNGNRLIEIIAFNGEDYYAVPGQMNYLEANGNRISNILLNINIDGAGYREGPSSFSLFDLPSEILDHTRNVIDHFEGLAEGGQWVQGDHSIFIQYSVTAIAVSSGWFIDNMADQDVTHTPKDNIGIVDCTKIVEVAQALNNLIRMI
ncbi:MAG: M28 family peptidase [Bacteroidales bacterium]